MSQTKAPVSVAIRTVKTNVSMSLLSFRCMLFCCFPAVIAGFRRFTMVVYCLRYFFDLCGQVAFFRGEVAVMATGKTKQVQAGKTVNVQGENGAGKKVGRPLKVLSADITKKAIEAAKLGIPLERIAIGCGFFDGGQQWQQYLARNQAFANAIKQAQFEGELELTSVVRQCGNGWQGSAWLLERTRGYVARASLEHTGKGGKELSVSGNLLGAFGGQSK
jgi:hypothetical protein